MVPVAVGPFHSGVSSSTVGGPTATGTINLHPRQYVHVNYISIGTNGRTKVCWTFQNTRVYFE